MLFDHSFEVRYHFVDLAGVFWRDEHVNRLAGVQRFERCRHAGEAKLVEIFGVGLANFCLPISHAFAGFSGVAVASRRTTVGALAASRGVLPERLHGIGELSAGCDGLVDAASGRVGDEVGDVHYNELSPLTRNCG